MLEFRKFSNLGGEDLCEEIIDLIMACGGEIEFKKTTFKLDNGYLSGISLTTSTQGPQLQLYVIKNKRTPKHFRGSLHYLLVCFFRGLLASLDCSLSSSKSCDWNTEWRT